MTQTRPKPTCPNCGQAVGVKIVYSNVEMMNETICLAIHEGAAVFGGDKH